jgi:hypothetical protein
MTGGSWDRARSALALSAGATAAGFTIAAMLVDPPADPTASLENAYILGAFVAIVVGLAAVGALIAVRRPENPLGWMFLVTSALMSVSAVGGPLLAAWHETDASPIAGLLAWLGAWSDTLGAGILLIFVPLLYPTGRLPSPRWWPLAVLAGLDLVAGSIAGAFKAGPMQGTDFVNPLGIPAATALLEAIERASTVSLAFILGGVVASIVARYRHASAVEKPQLKWFVYPAGVAAVAFAISVLGLGGLSDAAWGVGIGLVALIPPAMGIAILRYHVFEIDRIASRTLTYGLLSALLAGIYLAGVLVLQTILSPFGQADSPVAVAGSTLVAAVLMQPLRVRLKRIVDRRFNRSRLDAERTIEVFRTRIRDDTDLDRIAEGLAGTVVQALSPSSVSVWLRAP